MKNARCLEANSGAFRPIGEFCDAACIHWPDYVRTHPCALCIGTFLLIQMFDSAKSVTSCAMCLPSPS
jgi:hypothetical protein